MARTIRFHLDETCRQSIATGLRLHGIDVTTTAEAGLLSATDPEQLEFARQHARVVFTHDSDFVGLHETGVDHCGIIYCHQKRRSIGEIIRGLVLVWEVYEPDELRNRL